MLLSALPLDELRRRVREAEALLRVAKSHARGEHESPDAVAYATQRIATLLGEVDGLFPGLHEPHVPNQHIDELVRQLTAAAEAAQEGAPDDDLDASSEGEEGEEGEGDEGDEGEEELEIDYAKLALAIENEELMGQMPEPERSAFREVARHLIETHERQVLMQRIADGIGELSELTERNAEEARRRAALALTFEELANRRKA